MVIPEILVETVLRYSHESPAAGHAGRTKAVHFLRERFYFPKMWQRTVEHVAKCKLCPLYKGGSTKPAPALAYKTPEGPFMRVSIDLVTGFKTSLKGNNVLLVMIDNFTRACELVPLPNKSAEVVAKAIHDHLICRYQSPLESSSDNGSEFINCIIKKNVRILEY